MAYLTTDLIQDVRSQCRVADNDPDYTDVNLLRIATQELMGNIYPFLIGLREDYFVQECLIQVVSGQNFYEISDRAFAGTLREIKLINSVSGETVNLKRYDYEEPQANTARSYGVPTGFVVQDNYLIFDLIPSSSDWTLVQYIWLKPSKQACTSFAVRDSGLRNQRNLDDQQSIWSCYHSAGCRNDRHRQLQESPQHEVLSERHPYESNDHHWRVRKSKGRRLRVPREHQPNHIDA